VSASPDNTLAESAPKLAGSGATPPPAADRGAQGSGVLGWVARYAVVGIWVLICVIYGLAEPSKFLDIHTFQTIFSSQTPLVLLTMALLCTICVGEFVDLSIASILGLSAVIVPVLSVLHGWNVWAASGVALAAAVAAGALNGLLVVYLGVDVIVVTLGMGTLLLGVALWVTHLSQQGGLPASYGSWVNNEVFGLPLSFYYGLAVVLVFAYVLAFTPLGRHIRAIGSNRDVSRLAGVRVNRIRMGAFIFGGLLAGLGGVLNVASLGGYDPNSSQTYLLPTFAATFLGTAVVQLGKFNPIGTFIGIYFLETGIIGLQLLGVEGWVSDVFYGGVLVIAVSVTTVIRNRQT
jgi:ribose transport system permease protein